MVKRLVKVGNSYGLILDKPILDMLGLRRSDSVELAVENGTLTVRRASGKDARERRSR
jgi:antitoxin component of MazEF toxin-antitoxin module